MIFFSRKPEVAVLEYKTQQYKLLPQLAAAYSAMFAVNAMEKKYRSFVEKMRTGDISELPEVWAVYFKVILKDRKAYPIECSET